MNLQVAKELSDVVKEKVKGLGFDRYKLIVQVTVGQKVGQAMRIASRCLWVSSNEQIMVSSSDVRDDITPAWFFYLALGKLISLTQVKTSLDEPCTTGPPPVVFPFLFFAPTCWVNRTPTRTTAPLITTRTRRLIVCVWSLAST